MKNSNAMNKQRAPEATRGHTIPKAAGQRHRASLQEPTLAGVWLDRRRACLVVLHGSEETVATLDSGVEERTRSGGRPPPEPGKEKRTRNRRRQQLARYFAQLIRALRDADAIYLLGPGETKRGLEQELRQRPELAQRLLAVETAGSMTSRQLVDRVRRAYDERR